MSLPYFSIIDHIPANLIPSRPSGDYRSSLFSLNLPVRKLSHYGFLVLAMSVGLDSAIMVPTNRDIPGLAYTTEALPGQDDYCMEYIGAYSEGLIGPVRK